jgi:hypothetical protein
MGARIYYCPCKLVLFASGDILDKLPTQFFLDNFLLVYSDIFLPVLLTLSDSIKFQLHISTMVFSKSPASIEANV